MLTTKPINKHHTSPIISKKEQALDIIEVIKCRIINIIHEDKKLDIPVFSFIKDSTIDKLAYFLSGNVKRSIAIGVAGETASGKSTITLDIIERLENLEKKHKLQNVISRVNTDDYYYDRSEMVKLAGSFAEFAKNYDLDCPDALELDLLKNHLEQLIVGNEVMLPKYDMSGTAIRWENHTLAKPSKIIMSEGMYNLNQKIADVFDFSIYVDVSREEQKNRWYRRAQDRKLLDADAVYQNAVYKAEEYVIPTSKKADIIFNGEASRDDYRKIADKFISIVEEFHINSKENSHLSSSEYSRYLE